MTFLAGASRCRPVLVLALALGVGCAKNSAHGEGAVPFGPASSSAAASEAASPCPSDFVTIAGFAPLPNPPKCPRVQADHEPVCLCDARGRVTRWESDGRGADEDKAIHLYAYDDQDRVTRFEAIYPAAPLENGVTTYTFGPGKSGITRTVSRYDGGRPTVVTTDYERDVDGRVLTMTSSAASDPKEGMSVTVWTFRYDAAGQRVAVTERTRSSVRTCDLELPCRPPYYDCLYGSCGFAPRMPDF